MISTLRRLIDIAGMPWWRVATSVALGALAVGFGVALITTAGYLISRAAEQPPILALTVTIVLVRFFALARPVTRYVERLASHDLALRALGRIRAGFYQRIEPLAPAQLQGFRDGDLLNRMVGDVDALQGLYLRGIAPPIIALTVSAAAVVAIALVAAWAALILAVGLLIAGIAIPVLGARITAAAGERQAAGRGDLTAEFVELLRGAPELVAYGRESATLDRVDRLDEELSQLGRKDANAAGLADALSIFVAGATTVGVLALAVDAHHSGVLDRVMIATLALLALASFDAVVTLPAAARELSLTLASGRRVLGPSGDDSAVQDPLSPIAPPSRAPTVVLESVTVRYGPDQAPALSNFNLTLRPGQRVGLVGPSGAGKTTVTNLLLRFLDPSAGRITVDGHELSSYRQHDVREVFALAGQEAHIFNSSIRENLLIAEPKASDQSLTEVLELARLGPWLDQLPDGLDTLVGEGGGRLSGGQRQRLVLARALLADAPILILDEPTAHLDPLTAQALMNDLLDIADKRTVLLITHRPEGLDRMDEIVVCNGGD